MGQNEIFGQNKKKFGQKNFWVKKFFLVKKIFGKKNFGLNKLFGQLALLVTKLEFLTFFSTDRTQDTGYTSY